MQIVPVLDLLGGEVVRARHGDRASYRPIETPIAAGSDPVEITRGLCGLHRFSTFYIADLDAIQGIGDNFHALRRLRAAFPQLSLWVDNGAAEQEAVDMLAAPELGCTPVLGSETQQDAGLIASYRGSRQAILSLDFRGPQFQGPAQILASPNLWPSRIIVMTLAKVGSGAGPDFERLKSVRKAAPGLSVYAAGGVRNADDCLALERDGLAGALVASALHDGQLTAEHLQALDAPV